MPTNVNSDNSVFPKPTRLGDDLLFGVEQIAEEIGQTTRMTYHMIKTGQLPAEKVAGKLCSSKSALRKHFARILGEVA
jgi:hypothetical protein